MTWVLEEPLPIVLCGTLVVALVGAAWMKTGRRPLLYALAASLLATGLLLVLERLVVTDREQIHATLHAIAALIEANDTPAALAYVHSGAAEVIRRGQSELPKYRFERVDIKRNLRIVVDRSQQPPVGVADFNVVVVLSDKQGLISRGQVPRYAVVTFREEADGEWRVSGYEHFAIGKGLMRDRR